MDVKDIVESNKRTFVCNESFQESLGNAGNIAYIDVDKDEHLAHIRCFDAESAKSAATAGVEGYTLKLLQGMYIVVLRVHFPRYMSAKVTERKLKPFNLFLTNWGNKQ